jgi:hypothetical protein
MLEKGKHIRKTGGSPRTRSSPNTLNLYHNLHPTYMEEEQKLAALFDSTTRNSKTPLHQKQGMYQDNTDIKQGKKVKKTTAIKSTRLLNSRPILNTNIAGTKFTPQWPKTRTVQYNHPLTKLMNDEYDKPHPQLPNIYPKKHHLATITSSGGKKTKTNKNDVKNKKMNVKK